MEKQNGIGIAPFKTLHPSRFQPFTSIFLSGNENFNKTNELNITDKPNKPNQSNKPLKNNKPIEINKSHESKVCHTFLMTESSVYKLNLSSSAQAYSSSHRLIYTLNVEQSSKKDKQGIFPSNLKSIGSLLLDDFTWEHSTPERLKELRAIKAYPFVEKVILNESSTNRNELINDLSVNNDHMRIFQKESFRILLITGNSHIQVVNPQGQMWDITEQIQKGILDVNDYEKKISPNDVLGQCFFQKFIHESLQEDLEESELFSKALLESTYKNLEKFIPEIIEDSQTMNPSFNAFSGHSKQIFDEGFLNVWNQGKYLNNQNLFNQYYNDTQNVVINFIRKRKRPNFNFQKRKRRQNDSFENLLSPHYFNWSQTTITDIDTLQLSNGLFQIAIGSILGSVAIFQSDFKDSKSSITLKYIYTPEIEVNTLLENRIHSVKWINEGTLITCTVKGVLKIFNYDKNNSSLLIMKTIETRRDDLIGDSQIVTNFTYDHTQEMHCIVIVYSLSAVCLTFTDLGLNQFSLYKLKNQNYPIQCTCIVKNRIEGNQYIYLNTKKDIISWNLTEGTTSVIKLPATFQSDDIEVNGFFLSPNNLILHTLLKRDDMTHLVNIPLIPTESVREFLLNLEDIHGTSDIALYCECLKVDNVPISFFEIFRGFESKSIGEKGISNVQNISNRSNDINPSYSIDISPFKQIAYRASPYISQDWRIEIYRMVMYDFVVEKLNQIPIKSKSSILFCDWMLIFFQRLNVKSQLIKETILEIMLQIYQANEDETCSKQVERLLNQKKSQENIQEEFESFKKFIIPSRSIPCNICSKIIEKEGNIDLKFQSSCGHYIVLDIQTLLPADLIHCTVCEACGLHSSYKMKICHLCGNEYCTTFD